MDGIICYTPYLPEGEERDISFLELLFNLPLYKASLSFPKQHIMV